MVRLCRRDLLGYSKVIEYCYLSVLCGRSAEAHVEFERAASLTENLRERELLQRRAAECAAEGIAGN